MPALTLRRTKQQSMPIQSQVFSIHNSDSIYVRKIAVTSKEETLVCLDSDFATFHLYDLKKQHRFSTWKYKNESLVEPKVFSFVIDKDDKLILVGGDQAYSGDDKKRKGTREAFMSLHKLSPGFECLHLLKMNELDKQIITMVRDPASGLLFASDYGKNIIVLRIAPTEKIDLVQVLKDVHTDYPFSMIIRDNRIYTCSLSQKVTAIEFQADP